MIGQPRAEDALVADRAVREDQHRAGVAQREVGEPVGERRQPAPGVDQDRHARLFGELEDVVEVAAVEDEVLRARVELDAAAPRSPSERSASASAPSAGSRRQNGTSRPSLSPAQPSTRSLGRL